MRKLLVGICALTFAVAAQADVVVTEIWPGSIAGSEATSDWFELTNFGPSAVDGSGWYYDDSHADPTADTAIQNIGTIGVGESVVVLVSWEDGFVSSADAVTAFNSMWDVSSALSGVQIGWIDAGHGLGGSDSVFVFDGNTSGANTIATNGYSNSPAEASFVSQPDGTWNQDYAQDGVWGAYTGALAASDSVGIGNAVGSPGIVPEPTTLVLLGLGAVAVIRRR